MAVKTRIAHPSVEERQAHGKEARDRMPRSSHTGWGRPATVPTRSGCSRSRTAPGSRTWCRSATGGCWSRRSPSIGARPRSWPPTSTAPPSPASQVQLCGDAHLSNFGLLRLA